MNIYAYRLGLIAIGYSLLVSCSAPSVSSTEPGTPTRAEKSETSSAPAILADADRAQADVDPMSTPHPEAQQLPISAAAEIAGEQIQLEVARTPLQQAKGLMHRPPLPADRGMLFSFDPPRPVQFWMKNTPSPLDMVFLRAGEVQAIVSNVPPCTADPCPTYGPDSPLPIDQVIELRAGRAAELGLAVGDRISIQFLE